MFFTILAYSIQIIAILAFIFFQVFPCHNLLGPRLGSGKQRISKWRRNVAGRKLEKQLFGIRDIWFWLE
ncbi:hypothetical protein ES703_102057 [subsurface metagenome]